MADIARKSHKRKVVGSGDAHQRATQDAAQPAPAAGAESGTEAGAGAGSNTISSASAPVRIFDAAPAVEASPASVNPPEVPKRRQRGPNVPKADGPSKAKLSEQTAATLITVAETLAVALAGPEAGLEEAERLLIGQSLPKVLERLTPETMAQVESVTYPGMLIVGVAAYSLRLARLLTLKAAQARADAAAKAKPAIEIAATPTPGSNGAHEPAIVTAAGGVDNLASADGRQFIRTRGLDDANTRY